MAKYLDYGGLQHFWEKLKTWAETKIDTIVNTKVDNVSNTLAGIHHIDNAYIQFQRTLTAHDSIQGCTPFSFTGNYAYQGSSSEIYFAILNGTDDNRYLEICNPDGVVLGSVAFENGHYGSLSYDGETHLYALNYNTGSVDYHKLIEVDISTPSNPFISNKYDVDHTYAEAYNFWYKDGKIAVGKLNGNIYTFYAWDFKNDTYELIGEFTRYAYPGSGRSYAHFSYDVEHDLFIQSGYGPTSFTVYASDGTLLNTVEISSVLNFAKVGEIEALAVYGEHVWFSSRRNEGDFGDNNRMAYFYYNTTRKIVPPYQQLTNTNASAHVSTVSNPYGRNNIFVGVNPYPVFHYFEDAINYIRELNKQGVNGTVVIDDDYPYIAFASDASFNLTNSGGGTLPGIEIKNCHNCEIYLLSMFRYDSSNVISSAVGEVIVWVNLSDIDIHALTNLPSTGSSYVAYINHSTVKARNITKADVRNSIVSAATITNSTLEQYTCALAKSSSNNTTDANSFIITA